MLANPGAWVAPTQKRQEVLGSQERADAPEDQQDESEPVAGKLELRPRHEHGETRQPSKTTATQSTVSGPTAGRLRESTR